MNKTLRLSLLSAALVAALTTIGCNKEEPAPAATAAPTTTAPAPPVGMPPQGAQMGAPQGGGGQSSMANALNDPNTPPDVKEKIRQNMNGGR
jgi:hypothetical protein